MAIKQRPGFKTNVDKSVKGTNKRSVYYDIKPGQKARLRFTPTSNEDGSLFFESSQHFKFEENGEPRAYACRRQHANDDCVICDYLALAEKVLGKPGKTLVDDHGASFRWHAQVVPIVEGDDAPTQTFVLGLSRTTAEKVNKILKMEQDNRQPLLTDPEHGQIIQIERNMASGFGTRYEVMGTNVKVNLDEFFPEWEKSFLNVEEALRLRIEENDVLLAAMKETFGNTIFDALTRAYNVAKGMAE